ncbi:hypothetical protein EDC01DRAFT_612311 [Geopyxis carbonaria]|nr:hypothetical protein EDC01DRAFT_612311 [Geopyxis carbonaria]
MTNNPGGDGKHTTLPPINSIEILAEAATKPESPQQGTQWRRSSESRSVFPQVQSSLMVAPSNRAPTQGTAQSPGLPPPTPTTGAFNGSDRPPIHHLSLQSRAQFMPTMETSAPFYPQHHQHYPPIKDATSSSPGTSYPALPSITTGTNANLFAQPAQSFTSPLPIGLGARRESTSSDFQYNSDQTATPAGPSTGDTMAGSGPDEPMISPRGRTGLSAGPSQAGPLAGGGFKCEHVGCKAPPFQTQYLLNSHANVHSSARPHYCPVKGCPRAEGGKGFKRKNEMIRHGLVHDSPGYVCPFCPDREHRYPRPDNLQRHVRVHHMDKDKDDPQLRDVLAQRPEGGNRGRRRRHGG